MRISLLLGLFLMFLLPNANAQPPGFTLLPVALNCGSTTPLCDVNNTYNATNGIFNANVPDDFCGSGSVGNNAQWIQFYAGTPSVTFHFDVSNCTDNGTGEGLQIAPWASVNCQDGTFVALGPCQDSNGGPTPTYDVVASGMTPGFCYYLLIDGWAGSECDYEITITNGSTVPPPIVIGGITLLTTGPIFANCPVDFSVNSQGDCVITDWTTSGGSINEGQYDSSVTFNNSGNYNVCFTAEYENSSCQASAQECINVVVVEPPHTNQIDTLCPGEMLTINNVTFSSTINTEIILQNIAGCDSAIIDLDLTVLTLNDLNVNLDTTICKGDSVYIGNNAYYTPGNPHVISLPTSHQSTLSGQYCGSIVRLYLSILDPRADIDPTVGIPCSGDSVTLVGVPNFNQLGQTQTLQWFYNNNAILGATSTTINVADAGDYIFEVTVEKDGLECIASDTVNVTQSVGGVNVNAGLDTIVTCLIPTIGLDGSTTDIGNFIYTWATDTGFIVSGENTLNPTISDGGCYFLEIYDIDLNCSGFDTVCVTEEVGKPTLVLSPDTVLTCDLLSVDISSVGSSVGATIQYTWSGPGLPNGNEHDPTISVNQGGTYSMTLFDSSNGCPSSGGIVVTMDTISPIAIAGLDTVLSCSDTIVPLNSVGSSVYGGIYVYTWSGPGIDVNINDQFPEVGSQGSYLLSIENTENGCTSTDSVEVSLSNDFPVADAGDNKILNCLNNVSVQLDGTASNLGIGYNLEWSGPGIDAGNVNQVSPSVSMEGWYFITVENINNGCFSVDSTKVFLDTLKPTLIIAMPDTIKCNPDNVLLDASGSFSPFVFDGNAANADTFTRCGGFVPNAFVEITFFIAEAGDFTFEWDGINDLYGYIYEGTFDPVNPCSNIVAQDDDSGPGLNPLIATYLESGVYILVTTYWAAGAPSDYTVIGVGVNQISYDWSGPDINIDNQNNSNPTVGVDGYYYLTLTNSSNGCTETDSVYVAIDTLSPVPLAIGDTLRCDDLNVTLMGSSDLTDVTYFWIDPTGDTIFAINPVVNEVGEYTLIAVNNNTGCVGTTTTDVIPDTNAPNISVYGGFLNCDSLMTEVSAISDSFPVEYNWNINGTNMSGPIQTVTEPGTYSVTITNTINHCETFGDVTVDQDVEDPIVVIVADDELDCDTREIGLKGTATGGSGTYTYTWTTTDGEFVGETNNNTPRINKPGKYDVQVRDAVNGCITDAFIIIDENTTYPTPGNVDATNINCYGEGNGTILFQNIAGGIPPYTYSIDNGETYNATPNFFLLDPGQYYINVKDALGCIWNDSVIVDEPQELLVDLGPDYFINLGDSTTLNADINSNVVESIVWTPSLDSCFTSECTSLTVGPYEPTIYTVTITDINGCVESDEVLVKINKERNVFLPTGINPNSVTGNSIFMVYGEIGQIKNVNRMMIFNRWGEKIFENKDFMPNDPTAGWDGSFGGSPMSSAVFMYVVELEYIDGNIEFFKGDVTLVR